ncbi:MAG: hypothetical protein IPM24_12850 [Bryobacterales bacterium]|nr:hypothetical protein [Bryobacterales bacterium]
MTRCLLAFLVLTAAAAQEPAVFREIGRATKELAEISGLETRKPVPYELIDRNRVEKFLRERMREVIKPEEIRAEEITLKKFGFVPREFNLEQSTIELLTEQAAAFYDFKKKKLFLTDWASSDMQESALVHELAHALADQHFDLDKFTKGAGESDDSALARMAVMEGQATWLMSEVFARRNGSTLIGNPALAESMNRASESGAEQYPVFSGSPLYLKETLVFPYAKGLLFQQAVADRMGKEGFTEVFRRPPTTSQQILHPEKYFDRVQPSVPDLPRMPGRGFKTLTKGMFGELDCQILIRQYASRERAETLAPLWRGGQYHVREYRKKGLVVLSLAVDWQTQEAAEEFFAFYRNLLAQKWTRLDVTDESATRLTGRGDDGYFEVTRDGSVVRSVEGLERPAAR